ncbi:MAG: MgtC/SapB family protein [Chloroflexi bacterium]|jgi:putative Mg2+ transporter-C (MgtC) family protein|nr:MgtC/SapB family protein [Dehalococcoidia bacterium]MCO5200371.1 MgtC/SapB family protein [Chloroflexota bacterium]NJD66481.1 MgtC/SapB family protein [Chloroflexota bacterium]PWB43345.1 MAG: magnesium transporter MgtC [Dehalococcoidia bacterium]
MSNAGQLELFLWALLALGLGAVVGFEREVRGHEAGFRTNALVCGGAAIFGLISNELGDTRIAANVVQGIGFLGAGLVIQRGHMVRGVTSAATIWVMAAIGLLVANQLWLTAVLASATVVVVLELAPVSERFFQWVRSRGAARSEAATNAPQKPVRPDEDV